MENRVSFSNLDSRAPATTVSVAMCTCQGGRYVREQLQSIAAQDRPPDELVICDDRSSDETIAAIRQFAESAPFPVHLEVNAERLGCSANFGRAISRCGGAWIFLADQDDVWMPHKIGRVLEVVARNLEVGLVFSDAVMVDARRQPLGYRLWESLCLSPRERRQLAAGRAIDVLLRRNVISGLAMAFRRQYRELILPVPAGWVHDGWIALLIAAVARCAAVGEPLVEYRQHPAQLIGGLKRSLYQQYLRGKEKGPGDYQLVADNYRAARERLNSFRGRLLDPGLLAALDEKVRHFQTRAGVRAGREGRLPAVLGEFLHGRYGRYSSGWKSLAQDLLL
jgi:glycosyltransferase involved in cell wall biosynthesis